MTRGKDAATAEAKQPEKETSSIKKEEEKKKARFDSGARAATRKNGS